MRDEEKPNESHLFRPRLNGAKKVAKKIILSVVIGGLIIALGELIVFCVRGGFEHAIQSSPTITHIQDKQKKIEDTRQYRGQTQEEEQETPDRNKSAQSNAPKIRVRAVVGHAEPASPPNPEPVTLGTLFWGHVLIFDADGERRRKAHWQRFLAEKNSENDDDNENMCPVVDPDSEKEEMQEDSFPDEVDILPEILPEVALFACKFPLQPSLFFE